jgi:hypothetical protein
MRTHSTVAPRTATRPEPLWSQREGRLVHRRIHRGAAAAIGLALAAAVTGCTPGASSVPAPSLALPSIDASAAASAVLQVELAALDEVDKAITANTTPTGLTTDEASQLQQLTATLRTKLQSGDVPSAKAAFDAVSAKVDELAAKLNSDSGKLLKDAVAALKALIPAS